MDGVFVANPLIQVVSDKDSLKVHSRRHPVDALQEALELGLAARSSHRDGDIARQRAPDGPCVRLGDARNSCMPTTSKPANIVKDEGASGTGASPFTEVRCATPE